MDNKIIGELLALIAKAKLSDKDKKLYTAFIRLAKERMQKGLRNNPEIMDKLVESYNKKKEIIKNKDKDAWKKLMEEEEGELTDIIMKDIKEEEDGKLEEIRAKLTKEV